jgi:3-hydroxybutyryl-CoA dehydrogenase
MAAEKNSELALAPGATVGIAGAGTMGTGIAQVAALAGHPVRLYDSLPGAAHAATERIRTSLQELVRKGKIDSNHAERTCARLASVSSLKEFSGCGLVIEAIVEDLDTKRGLFRELEPYVAPQTTLATNTSSISVTAIAAALERPEQLAGMHFFNPAPVMPLVEIVSGLATSADIANRLYATALQWGKTPVRARSTPGFIVNRVARPFYGEALRLLEERAADCATIDAVMRESGGFRMGPFELMDLIGNDVNYAVTRSVFNGFYGDPRFTPSQLQLELVQAGYFGRKTGRGFYIYQAGKPIAEPSTAAACPPPSPIEIYGDSPVAQALVARLTESGTRFKRPAAHADDRIAASVNCVLYRTDGRTATARAASSGLRNTIVIDLALDDRAATRAAIAAADQAGPAALPSATGLLQATGYAVSIIDDVPGMIVMRTMAMLANEAADAVNQDVCSIADLDLAMRKGVNYLRGPLEWADAVGIGSIVDVLEHLAEAYGEDRYRVSPLLRRKAYSQSKFNESDEVEPALMRQKVENYETARG